MVRKAQIDGFVQAAEAGCTVGLADTWSVHGLRGLPPFKHMMISGSFATTFEQLYLGYLDIGGIDGDLIILCPICALRHSFFCSSPYSYTQLYLPASFSTSTRCSRAANSQDQAGRKTIDQTHAPHPPGNQALAKPRSRKSPPFVSLHSVIPSLRVTPPSQTPRILSSQD